MRDPIAEVGDVSPGDLRMAISEDGGEFAGCISQRFKSVERGVLDEIVGQEGIASGPRPMLDELDALQDVAKGAAVPLLTHSATAS